MIIDRSTTEKPTTKKPTTEKPTTEKPTEVATEIATGSVIRFLEAFLFQRIILLITKLSGIFTYLLLQYHYFCIIGNGCIIHGIEYSGNWQEHQNGVANFQGGAEECHKKCKEISGCNYFVYRNNGCFPRNTDGNLNKNPNAVSGTIVGDCAIRGKQKYATFKIHLKL